MAKIKLFALGGQDEKGKNCFVLDIDNEIFIFNAGAKLPDNNMYGVNNIVADYNYLHKNVKRIKGVFIATPVYNNLMGLKHLLAQTDYNLPIYTSPIGAIVIEKMFETKINNKLVKPNIVQVKTFEDLKVGNIIINAFKVTNSIPNSLAFVLKTKDGNIVYVDDFIISNDKNKTFESQVINAHQILRNNTLAVIMGMNNAGKKGLTAPHHRNKGFYEDVLSKTENRMFVGCYAHDVYTIFSLATLAKQTNRPFIIYSQTFINVFNGIIRQRLYSPKNLISLPISEINKNDNAIVVIIENQDSLFPRLNKILDDEDKIVHLNDKDSLVLGVGITPGYESLAADLSDHVHKLNIPYFTLPKTILPMQACDEDIKHFVNVMNPKYVVPLGGLYKTEMKFVEALKTTKVLPDNIISLDNGQIKTIVDKNLEKDVETIHLVEKMISNFNTLDVGEGILYERRQMGENGIIILTMAFDKKHQRLIDFIDFKYFGVVNKNKSTNEVVKEIEDNFKTSLAECIVYDKQKRLNMKETKNNARRLLAKLFEKKFNKRPLVLPTIIDYYEA
ncbi:ribonuclease J [Ureaplasma miroungigenitalium]|uniref:ribonuclease J n=1 Tax=Ureaplasma miroungigenitalium TaxID=1042321 RepID=UPI0021E981C3|nr:ribonuclease J [Ureaplasma miroungigenitalium]MCV3734166.1 ribonuclease J [Ureaplasma miroungigenitalium]